LSNSDANIKTLVNLGLTGAQAKIYLALLYTGPASIREIAYASKVARPDTYRAILELQTAGIVEKILVVPAKFKPLNIIDAVGVLMLRRTKESIELNKKANVLIESLKEKKNEKSNSDDNQFVLVPGEALELKIRKLLESSKHNLSIMISRTTLLQWLDKNYEIVQNALKRKVMIKIISEESHYVTETKVIRALKKFSNFEERFIVGPVSVWLRIHDDKEILLTTSMTSGQTSCTAVFSNNPSLAEMAQNYFNAAWFSAIEPQDQVFKHDRRQFDYLFANFASGFSYNKLIVDTDGKPIDFVILETNNAFREIAGITKSIKGEKASKVFPDMAKNLTGLLDKYWPIISKGKSVNFEYYAHDIEKWFSILAYSPERGYFAAISEDISERKNAEALLKESEEKYRLLSKYAPAAIYEIDCKNFLFKQVNDCMCTLSGYSEKELLSMSPFDLLDAKSKIRFQEIMRKSFAGEKIDETVEFGVITKSGLQRLVTLTAKLTRKNNERDSVFVVAHDVTESKKAKEALIKSEEEYRSLFTHIMDGFAYCKMIFDEKGKPVDFIYLQINEAFEKITGLKREAVVGKRVTEVIPGTEKDNPELFKIYGRVSQTGKAEKFETLLKPLNLWLSVSVYSPEKGFFAAVFEDITERKQAEHEVIEQKEKAERYLNVVKSIILALDIEGKIILLNKKGYEILGYNEGELEGKSWVETCIPSHIREEVRTLHHEWVQGKAKTPENYENQVLTKNGSLRTIKWYNTALTDETGRIIGTLSSGEDITASKKAEADLKFSLEREHFLAGLIRNASIAIAVAYPDGRLMLTNKAFQKLTGYNEEELKAVTWNIVLTPPEWHDFEIKKLEEIKLSKESGVYRKEYIRKDGLIIPIEITVHPFFDDFGVISHYFGFITDITSRKKDKMNYWKKPDYIKLR
jgi:PAS domain S-box-containing protein